MSPKRGCFSIEYFVKVSGDPGTVRALLFVLFNPIEFCRKNKKRLGASSTTEKN